MTSAPHPIDRAHESSRHAATCGSLLLDARAEPAVVRTARAWIAEWTRVFSADVRDDAAVMTSELVSNAVRHGQPDVTVHYEIRGHRLEIGVGDHGPLLPSDLIRPVEASQAHGRGLIIVAALAQSWGVRQFPTGPGKTVFFTLVEPAG